MSEYAAALGFCVSGRVGQSGRQRPVSTHPLEAEASTPLFSATARWPIATTPVTQEDRCRTLGGVSVVPHPDEPTGLTVLPPEEALKRAQPLPSDEEMAIDGLTDEEWKAFDKVLAER